MKKKLLGILTSAVLLLSLIPAQAQSNVSFKDVSPTEWFYEAVNYVSCNNVMIGVEKDSFAPKDKLTRGMAVTILSRIYGADVSKFTEAPFSDIDMKKYYGAHAAWAKQNGVIHGMTDTEFMPDECITREQICVMLSNFFDFCNLSTRNTEVEKFADEDKIGRWALDAVHRMQRGRIVNGRDDKTFDPKGYTTRAEFAQIIYNTNIIKLLQPNHDSASVQP